MQGRRLAPTAGIAACLLVVGLVVAPYLVLDSLTVETYYDATIVGPWLVALFAFVTIIALLAGIQDRTDHATVAGASLVLGLVMLLIAIWWSVSVPDGLVEQLGEVEVLAYHRWALVLAAMFVPASAGWYASESM